MSALDDKAILHLLEDRILVISPILDVGEQIGPASVDLRLGTVAYTARARDVSHLDPRAYLSENGAFASEEAREQKLERHDVPFLNPLIIHPGELTLVPTLEWVELPANLVGTVTARSSWAREGLSIATATLIGPGYRGIITLELANLGHIPIQLYPGLRIAQISFQTVQGVDPKAKTKESTFNLSFEPMAGAKNIAMDRNFIPPYPVRQPKKEETKK